MIARRPVAGALALFWLLWLGGDAPRAADYEVRAYVQPESGILDTDTIRLVIEVQGPEQPQISTPHLPKLTNLKVIGGPSTSSQMRWVNGRTSATVSLIYMLLAEQPGPAEIPPLEVRVGSRTHRTEPIRFEVARAPSGPPPPSPRGREPTRQGEDRADVYLQARLGSDEVWLGQPVPLSVTLFAGTRVTGYDWREIPSFTTFWVEQDRVDPQAESYRTRRGDRPYTAYPVDRRILVPSSAGEYTIDPFIAQLQVRDSRDDLFDFFSIGRGRQIVRKTEPLKLRVRELPREGRPEDFNGAVGSFEMTVDLDRREALVDDAVALKVTVEGNGFLKSAPAPALDAPPDLKVFSPKSSDSLSIRRGQLVSRKTWEWVLVPLAAGELRLPEIGFSYFDPGEGRYRQERSEPLLLAVKRGEGPGADSFSRGGIRLQRQDIAFIKARRGRLAEGRARIQQKPYFVVLAALPLVLAPLWIILGRRQARLQQDRRLARARKAHRRARKRLRSMRRRMEQLDSGAFHEAVARALVEYVADRFNLAPAGLTYDRLDELLASRDVDRELRGRFRACLETCDFARFVPSSGQTDRRRSTLGEAGQLIERVERAL